MLSSDLKKYLDEQQVTFEELSHPPTFTASETAQSAHIPGKNMAKVVVVKIDGELAMTVLPAHTPLDLEILKKIAGAQDAKIAHEYEFNKAFPDCEVGAMPPFGERYHMNIYLADSLARRHWVAFPCGKHSDVIKMSNKDFLKILHPKILPAC